MPRLPDYKKAIEAADIILLSSNQFELPLNLEKLISGIKTINAQIIRYSETPIDGSENMKLPGFVVERKGIYYIAYNDWIENAGHNRFTLCHELGHIILNHDLSKVDDWAQETEANVFATELLMPEAIIQELVNRGYSIVNENMMEGIFNASHTACQIRIDEFRNMPEWHGRYTDHETIVNVQFRSYLDSFFPNKKNKYYDIDYEIEEERERDEWR